MVIENMNTAKNLSVGHDFREIWWLLEEPFVCVGRLYSLTAKSVQSTALSFQSVHHIHGCHSLPLGVLGVCHSITDHVLEENFENTTSLLVDQARVRLTPPRRARRRMAGLVMPWMLSRRIFR